MFEMDYFLDINNIRVHQHMLCRVPLLLNVPRFTLHLYWVFNHHLDMVYREDCAFKKNSYATYSSLQLRKHFAHDLQLLKFVY